jgi:hypothetical protein
VLLIRCFLGGCQLPDVEVREIASQFMWESQKIDIDESASAMEKTGILPKELLTYGVMTI